MKQGKKLLILPAVAVLLGMGTGCSDNCGNKAQDMAKKALMASVDNPAYSGGYPFSISGDIRSVPS